VLARNRARAAGVVPEDAVLAQLGRLAASLAVPQAWNGFTAVWRLTDPDEIDRVVIVRGLVAPRGPTPHPRG
jgi:hypothetical protein